jgi:ABC-type multidrug transport system permease subunit
MKALLHLALFDLRLQVVDRASIFFMFLMPMGFILFFGAVFRDRSPQAVRVSLPVVNADRGFLSAAFVDQLRGESFDVELHRQSLDSLDLDTRYLAIPAAFGDSVLAAHSTKLQFVKRASSNLTYDAAAELKLMQAQVRFIGNLVRWNPPTQWGEHGELGIEDAQKGRFLALVNETSNLTIAPRMAGKGRAVPSGMGQSIPGMLTMFVVMTVLIAGSEAITREKRDGTLRRLATTVLSPRQVILGKLIGLIWLGLAQAVIVVVATELFKQFGVIQSSFSWLPLSGPLLLLLLPYTFCIAGAGLLLSGIFRTTQQAESLAWLVGMTFAGLGGCWWPLEIVPGWLRTLGHFFPTAWAMDGLHGMISFGQGYTAVVLPALMLILFGFVFTALGVRTVRFAD